MFLKKMKSTRWMLESDQINNEIWKKENKRKPKVYKEGSLQLMVLLNFLEHRQEIVYKVDDEAGMWKRGVQHKLKSYIFSYVNQSNGDYKDCGFHIRSYKVEIVKCLGSLYIMWFLRALTLLRLLRRSSNYFITLVRSRHGIIILV